MQPWPLLRGGGQSANRMARCRGAQLIAGRDSREDETITIQPVGVLGVELEELAPENVGHRCHAPTAVLVREYVSSVDRMHVHGGTGMARVAGEGGINLDPESVSTCAMREKR